MIIPHDISMFSNVQLAAALPAFLLALGFIRLLSNVVYNVYFHPLRDYPGPKLFAATRISFSRMITGGKAHQKLAELHKRYGPVVRLGPETLDWADPRAFKDLMGHSKGSGGMENYRDPINTKNRPHSIINAGREDHARIRRVLAHGFSAQSMVEQQPLIQKQIDLLVQRLHEHCEGGKPLNMVAWYNYTTFDIIGDLAFGEPFGCLENSDYHPWVSSIFNAIHANIYRNQFQRYWMTQPFANWLIPKRLREHQMLHNQLSLDKVQKRMALGGDSRPDFVQSMMMKEGSLAMSRSEIEQTADTLIIAGSETTASVLSGVTFFLTTHPDAMGKLVEEVRTSFNSEKEIDVLSVQKLRYMLAVLDETMRLYPVVPMGLTRIMKPGGDYVCERFVPEGTRVMVSQWPMYHNEKHFAQPESFIPERWLGDARFANDNKSALQPFSVGPRNCIGRNLAMSEMRVILARVIWNFDMEIAEDSRNWTDQKLYGLWKKGPLNVHLTPRREK